jgi:hypothetical protein
MQLIGDASTLEEVCFEPTFNINEWFGFVYAIIHEPTGKIYIGKKQFFSTQNKKLGKKELIALPTARGRKPTKKKVITESNWKNYYSSNDEVKKLPKEELTRYLLKLCKTSKQLTYWEIKYLFHYDVLENELFFNDNIEGRYFRKDLI